MLLRTLVWPVLLTAPLLVACENQGAAYQIDGRNHAITLLREQNIPFGEVKQALVPARFPDCQRRYEILPASADEVKLELWQQQDRLFVARSGQTWYAVGTEECLVQKMEPIAKDPPGTLLGHFAHNSDGRLVFEAEARTAAQK